ncbi:MAG: DUF5685 family protein [Muricoprocola sp.]
MPGYKTALIKNLNAEDRQRYESFRCGLCHAMSNHHIAIGRMALNYDITFLSMFLTALYDAPESSHAHKCQIHPFKNQCFLKSEIINYAADMNIILLYYHRKSHWDHTKNLFSYGEAKALEKECEKIEHKYPEKCQYIRQKISELHEIRNWENSSLEQIAECIGDIMGEIFVPFHDFLGTRLRAFGQALGKYHYFLNLTMCDNKNLKKKTPTFTDTSFENFQKKLLNDMRTSYQNLNIRKDCRMIEYLLFSPSLPNISDIP